MNKVEVPASISLINFLLDENAKLKKQVDILTEHIKTGQDLDLFDIDIYLEKVTEMVYKEIPQRVLVRALKRGLGYSVICKAEDGLDFRYFLDESQLLSARDKISIISMLHERLLKAMLDKYEYSPVIPDEA